MTIDNTKAIKAAQEAIELLTAQIDPLVLRRNQWRDTEAALRLEQAAAASEYKVGDRVSVPYGYYGKRRVHEVTKLELARGYRGDSVLLIGSIVKKDGTLGSGESRLYGEITLVEEGAS